MKSKKWMSLCALAIIVVFFLGNIDLMIKPMQEYLNEDIRFTGFRDGVQENLKSDSFSFKNSFINFNGWFSRLVGKREINNTILADNGMLFPAEAPRFEMGLHGQRLASTNEVLMEMGIPFVYVQAPSKIDLKNEILPGGVENYHNENTDNLLAELAFRNVPVMDLRPDFCATIQDVEKYFYKTDHHWNYLGAFKAFGIILDVIQEALDDHTDVSYYKNLENWESHRIPNSFLGSDGKRVGKYVTGLDDFEYFTPKFETDMTFEMPERQIWDTGTFEECIIKEEYIDPLKDYFVDSMYLAYLGLDYGPVEIRNKQPAINKKILIVKDSFGMPMLSYLSTVFEAIDILDLRYDNHMSLIEYVYLSKPDMVVMIHNPSSIHRMKEYNWGYEQNKGIIRLLREGCLPLTKEEKIRLEARYNSYSFEEIYDSFEPNGAYTLEIGGLTVEKGEVDYISARLYDRKTGQFLLGKTFDMEEGRHSYKWSFKTFDQDCSEVHLQLYCGEYGKTENVTVEYENVVLYKGWNVGDN